MKARDATVRGRVGSRNTPEKIQTLLPKFGAVHNIEQKVDLSIRVYLVNVGDAEGEDLTAARASLTSLVKQAGWLSLWASSPWSLVVQMASLAATPMHGNEVL